MTTPLTARRAGVRPLPVSFPATVYYEFVMAVRGKVLWLSVLPLLAVAILLMATSPRITAPGEPSAKLATCAVLANLVVTVGVGVALADRFSRLGGLGLTELLASTPASAGWRMAGTLVGALGAALTPSAAVLVLAGGVVAVSDGEPTAPLWALVSLFAVVVPGVLLFSVFAATLALFAPLPVTRAVAVLVWFWTTVFNTRVIPLPSPTGTLLSPLGDYAGAGWLGAKPLWAGRARWTAFSPAPDGAAALCSLAALLALAAVLFVLARRAASVRG